MRELTINERQFIAGGVGEEWMLAGAVVATAAAGYGIYSYLSGPKIVPIKSTYDVVTPIYNQDGVHIANNVETYEHIDYIVQK